MEGTIEKKYNSIDEWKNELKSVFPDQKIIYKSINGYSLAFIVDENETEFDNEENIGAYEYATKEGEYYVD